MNEHTTKSSHLEIQSEIKHNLENINITYITLKDILLVTIFSLKFHVLQKPKIH